MRKKYTQGFVDDQGNMMLDVEIYWETGKVIVSHESFFRIESRTLTMKECERIRKRDKEIERGDEK